MCFAGNAMEEDSANPGFWCAGLDLKNLGALAAALRVQAQDSHASTSRPSPIISPLQDHAILQKVLETGATTNAVDSAQHDNMMTRSMPASAMSSSQQGMPTC